MFRFFINLFFIFLGSTALLAQTTLDSISVAPVNDSIAVSEFYHPKKYGIRIGADIIKPIHSLRNDNFNGFELVGDYRISTKQFLAGEIGYITRDNEGENYQFSTKGGFLKLGINHNMYTNWLDMDNEIFFGVRYAFSIFTHNLNNYTVFQNGILFDKRTNTSTRNFGRLNAHWLEIILGVKTEVYTNLYLGIAANINQLVFQKQPDNFDNLYIPGFGDVTGNGGAGINYTITYRIPFYKK